MDVVDRIASTKANQFSMALSPIMLTDDGVLVKTQKSTFVRLSHLANAPSPMDSTVLQILISDKLLQ